MSVFVNNAAHFPKPMFAGFRYLGENQWEAIAERILNSRVIQSWVGKGTTTTEAMLDLENQLNGTKKTKPLTH